MKRHNGHNGHGQPTVRNMSSGLQDTLAQQTARSLPNALQAALAETRASPAALEKSTALSTGTYAADVAAVAGHSGTGIGATANANALSAVALGGDTVAGYNCIAIGTLAKG